MQQGDTIHWALSGISSAEVNFPNASPFSTNQAPTSFSVPLTTDPTIAVYEGVYDYTAKPPSEDVASKKVGDQGDLIPGRITVGSNW